MALPGLSQGLGAVSLLREVSFTGSWLSCSPRCAPADCLCATRSPLQLQPWENKQEGQAANRTRTNGKPGCSVKYLASHFEQGKDCTSSIYYKAQKREATSLQRAEYPQRSLAFYLLISSSEDIKMLLIGGTLTAKACRTSVFCCSDVLQSMSRPPVVAVQAGWWHLLLTGPGMSPPREQEVMQISCQPCFGSPEPARPLR